MKPLFILMIFLFLIDTALPGMISAQPPFPDSDPDPVPIDGGLAILTALGGAYAIKKLRECKGQF